MPYPSKIVDRAEVERWIREGRTYRWMKDEYRKKYNIEISRTAFSNIRAQQGLPPRQSPSLERIIPWEVKPEHRSRGFDLHLHTAARLEDGMKVTKVNLSAFESWWAAMQENDWVVAYDPHTEDGFYPAPRRPGVDLGYIREPEEV